MDIGGIPHKILGGVEKHATLLAFAGSTYLRLSENTTPEEAVRRMFDHFTNLNLDINGGNYGALGEAIKTISDPSLLGYKLLTSNHAYSLLVKVGVGLWVASELGIIPSRYGTLGKKAAMGAGAAAILMPGSGPSGNSGSGSSGAGYSY